MYFEPQRISLSKWLDLWLDEYVKSSAKPLTYSTYKSRLETHIKPALGRIKLTSLNATQIQAFYNDLLRVQELSPKTIKNIHGILHKALEQALKLRYIGLNPADACTLPRIEKKEIQPLTESEIAAFLDAIQEGEPLRDLFTVALFTGMREGEICGLSWDAVNFREGTITVKQQLCKEKEKGGQHYIATTKNDKARTLTAALQEGDDVKTVQQNLGHATASFTLDVYGHVSEKMKKESAARMQSYFEKIKA